MEEWCQNSRRWIRFMIAGRPLKSCPFFEEQFLNCEKCGYYEEREPTKHLKRKLKTLRAWGLLKKE